MTSSSGSDVQCRLGVVQSRRTFVEQRYGAEGLARYQAAASRSLLALLEDKQRRERDWIPFELMVEATTLVDRLFGAGDLLLCRELGYFSSVTRLGPWTSWAVRHTPLPMILRLTSGAWRHHYSHGRLAVRAEGAALVGSIEDFPVWHRAHCLAVLGWIYGTASMGPRKNVVVEELSCRALGNATCSLRTTWEPA